MNISEVNSIASALGDYLSPLIVGEDGKFGALYVNESMPSSELPESFLEITGNGPLSSRASQLGICEYNLLVVVQVKLRSDGTVNTVREDYLLGLLSGAIPNPPKSLILDKFHYSMDKQNLVYSGRDLTSGYSSKIININVKIY